MAGNSELMDVIRKNVDNHHAKISDALYQKWLEVTHEKRIENRESAFHLSVVIDLKTEVVEYFESSNLAISMASHIGGRSKWYLFNLANGFFDRACKHFS